MTRSEYTLHIGIDFGGTKATALCKGADEGMDRALRFSVQGANLQTAGADIVSRLIANLVSECKARYDGNPSAHIVAGIAGAGRPEDYREVEQHFKHTRERDSDHLTVYSDAAIALEGAFSGLSGVIIIAGTGSGVYALDQNGDLRRAGGWGPRLGDPGSGTSIGLLALRSVARAFDGGPTTRLRGVFKERLRIDDRADLIRVVYRDGLNPASCAPWVLDVAMEGDEVAAGLVTDEIVRLAAEARLVMDEKVDPRFVLLGGLCDHAWFRHQLEQAVKTERPAWRCVPPDGSPEAGALRFVDRRAR